MFKRLSVFIAMSLLSANAMAGDWTGWHVGGNAGYGDGSSDAKVSLGGQWSIESQALRDHVTGNWSHDLDASGSAYGLQFGYDHQFESGLVLGAELDYSMLDIEESRSTGSNPVPGIPSLSYNFANSIEAENMASLRAKLGYGWDRHLIYATAGWAQVEVEATAQVLSNGNYSKLGRESDRLDGVQYGIGYEFDFGNQWSLRAEYLRTETDDVKFQTAYRPGSAFLTPAYTENFKQEFDLDIFRLGVNYRF
jgi:outer membrane immunogenic protein